MKVKLSKKFTAMFFTLCMLVSFVPIQIFAAETDITEVNIKGVTNELWSSEKVTFATVDENSNYTIEDQKWCSSQSGSIIQPGEKLKPIEGEKYNFVITLNAKEGYVFPIKPKTAVFYDGVFKVNGTQYDNAAATVSSGRKTLTATLFAGTKVKGVTDNPGATDETTVRDNFTDCQVTDDINLKKGSDYVIDFTKEDNLSMALRAMSDLEKTKYYKFANSDKNHLVKTEDASEALIKIVGNKSKNRAIMTLVGNIDANASYALKFVYIEYTGSKLTYKGTGQDEKTGKPIVKETRDEYYTRYHFNCKLNLINDSSTTSQISDPDVYKIIEGENSSLIKNTDDTLTFRANGDLSKFAGIKIDDESIDPENYVTASGSTIVTLKNEYLKTLSVGEHKITFVYTDGECSTSFEIKESGEIYENSENPQTGDNGNILLWTSLFLISALGILWMIIYNRKKKHII